MDELNKQTAQLFRDIAQLLGNADLRILGSAVAGAHQRMDMFADLGQAIESGDISLVRTKEVTDAFSTGPQ